jgi:hypothetical protein
MKKLRLSKVSKVAKPKKQDSFGKVLEHIETLPTYKEKIAYLIVQKTTYEQNQEGLVWNFGDSKNFAEKCQLEIDKLEKLMRLEATPKQTTDSIKKHKAYSFRFA